MFEETGIDLRQNLERLIPYQFSNGKWTSKKSAFFILDLLDTDTQTP